MMNEIEEIGDRGLQVVTFGTVRAFTLSPSHEMGEEIDGEIGDDE